MGKKLMLFTTKGMNLDLSVSKFNPEFSFENHNLRLSTNESNTLMSWVNEKGPAKITIYDEELPAKEVFLSGIPIGTCVLQDYLVVFTHNKESNLLEYRDHIYRLKYKKDDLDKVVYSEMFCKELFHGNLNFSTKYPIKTLANYESEDILKVYWIDGLNQTRFINLKEVIDRYYNDPVEKKLPINSSFDFFKTLELKENIKIIPVYDGEGEFPIGVIQYAFTYSDRNGVESSIFYTTPLNYIYNPSKGIEINNPDYKVNMSFQIIAENLDTNYDKLNIYSIISTSKDSERYVKNIANINISTGRTHSVQHITPFFDTSDISSWDEASIGVRTNSNSEFESITKNSSIRKNLPFHSNFETNQLPHTLSLVEISDNQESTSEYPEVPSYTHRELPSEFYEIITSTDTDSETGTETTNTNTVRVIKPANTTFPLDTYTGDIAIPPTVTLEVDGTETEFVVKEIADNAFEGAACSAVYFVVYIGEEQKVVRIGKGAFKNCTNLRSINLPDSVTEIGDDAFSGCNRLSLFGISENTETIGKRAFENCYNLATFTIPESIQEAANIGYHAFKGCFFEKSKFKDANLEYTDIDAFNWGLNFITKETEIGLLIKSNTVVGCRYGAKDVYIPDKATETIIENGDEREIKVDVTNIGERAFANHPNLHSVHLPDSIIIIEQNAFYNCQNLTEVTIGSGIETINSGAFKSCPRLTSLEIMADSVPDTSVSSPQEIFEGINDACVLHIPLNKEFSYKSLGWTAGPDGIFKGGYGIPIDSRFEEGKKYFYIIKKSEFPELTLRINDSYYTWSDSANDTDTIYIYPKYIKFKDAEDNNTEFESPFILCERLIDNTYERVPISQIIVETINTITWLDNNKTGETIHPSDLLSLGNFSSPYAIAQTMEQKDGVLFLGNLLVNEGTTVISDDVKEELLTSNKVSKISPLMDIAPDKPSRVKEVLTSRAFLKQKVGEISWVNTLGYANSASFNGSPVYYDGASCFKAREYYRLGIQFQNTFGQWSEPCWIGDKQWKEVNIEGNVFYGPFEDNNSAITGDDNVGVLCLPEFEYTIPKEIQEKLYLKGFKRMRAVYVCPQSINDRTVIGQGVINAAMLYDTGTLLPSWLFRTRYDISNYTGGLLDPHLGLNSREILNYQLDSSGAVVNDGKLVSFTNRSDYWWNPRTDENTNSDWGLPNNYSLERRIWEWTDSILDTDRIWMQLYFSTEIWGNYEGEDGNEKKFQVVNKVGTIYSPDFIGGDKFNTSNLKVRKVGYALLDNTYSSAYIRLDTSKIQSEDILGEANTLSNAHVFKFRNTSALMCGNFFKGYIIKDDEENENKCKAMFDTPFLWAVCMWHKKGPLNNDIEGEGFGSPKITLKIFANYRYSKNTYYLNPNSTISATKIDYWNYEDATHILNLDNYNYRGCVETSLNPIGYSAYYPVGIVLNLKNGLELAGVDGDVSRLINWKPRWNSLPFLKIHQNYKQGSLWDPEEHWVHLILWYDAYEDKWKTASDEYGSKRFPSYSYIKSKVERTANKYPTIRWNSLGGEYEKLGEKHVQLAYNKDPVPMYYKSVPHAVVLLHDTDIIRLLEDGFGTLPIVELYKDYNVNTTCGGITDEVLRRQEWIPCGPVVDINTNNDTKVQYKWGDSYYLRYECLKTYPYSLEETTNEVIEIGSFMLENRVNTEARSNNTRGYKNMLIAGEDVSNYRTISIYSQKDNFFNYKIYSDETEDIDKESSSNKQEKHYTNQIIYSLTKQSGEDVDTWTNISQATPVEFDGNLGSITSIVRFNNQLIVFQEKGISQLLYNENVQIASEEGVPIELANSKKVDGKRYLTNSIGCSNKWSIVTTSMGIYFIDSYSKDIYLYDGKSFTNVSSNFGFNTWCKNNIPSVSSKWNPDSFDNIVTYYDKLNQEVLFINGDTALAFSEKLGMFTSFYDYGAVPFFCDFGGAGIWIDNKSKLWLHQAGEYCNFFGECKPYSMTLIGNPEPLTDKIFTNLEFRANTDGDLSIPFDTLETWNEYLRGIAYLSVKNGLGAMQHNLKDGTASLNRKFRIWRCDIPRDNDTSNGRKAHPMDRMRNPWIYLKLEKKAESDRNKSLPRVEIHDMVMTYFN